MFDSPIFKDSETGNHEPEYEEETAAALITLQYMIRDRQNADADGRLLTLVFSWCYLETGLKSFFHFRQDAAVLVPILTEDNSHFFIQARMISLFLSMIESAEGRSLFEHVYYEYRGLMHSIAMSILNDHHLAEDAVGEAFWRIARRFDMLMDNLRRSIGKENLGKEDILCPPIKAFTVIVVKNVSLSYLKKLKKENTLFVESEDLLDALHAERCSAVDEELSPMDVVDGRETADNIAQAVNELSETLRHTMYLHIVLELSIGETADILGLDYETVKKRIQRGREKLQRKVGRI